MRKTRKFTAILLVTVLALAMLTGCGSTGSDGSSDSTADSNSVLNTGVLRVGMECSYAPYNWTQSDDSNGAVAIVDTSNYAYGYDVMMAKYLAEYNGWEVEIYQIDWDSLPVALTSGKVDCVIAGQSITSERLETVDFTEPYYYASVVGLVKTDGDYTDVVNVADLDGVTATSQLNTIWYDALDQISNVDKQAAMETVPNMLTALKSGKVDFVCTDMPTAMAACAAYSDMMIIDFEGGDGFEVSDEEINIGISVKKGNDELTEKLNAGLATLTEDDYEEMMNDAISVQPLAG